VESYSEIVVLGSLNVDMVVSTDRMPKVGETISGKEIRIISGGKGANQAVSCARLGSKVVMLGAIGNDQFGQQVLDDLTSYGVNTQEILVLDKPTGTATIIHTPEDNCIVVIPGANQYYTVEKLKPFETHISQATILLVQLEICIETVEHALNVARANNVKTILNPAPAKELPIYLLQMVDYLTPNETELKFLCGSDFTTEDQLKEILQEWESVYKHKVIVTRGAKGCSYLANGELITISPAPVTVEDTTGAGDAFNGALAYWIAQNSSLEEAVNFAVKASALSVGTFGAQAGMPTLSEVMQVNNL